MSPVEISPCPAILQWGGGGGWRAAGRQGGDGAKAEALSLQEAGLRWRLGSGKSLLSVT